MTPSITRGALLVFMLGVLLAGMRCSRNETTQPSPPSDSSVTIVISRTGASPRNLTVPRGSQITFVNDDSVVHQMYSDPHPEHTDCPEFDAVGQLAPGQRRQTTNLVTARTCNFHDHLDFFNTTLRGAVVIQ